MLPDRSASRLWGAKMHAIDVDFEVYKQLTVRRATEQVTYNDVVRDLLGIKAEAVPTRPIGTAESSSEDWVAKGIRFPFGTDFRASYKGKMHTAKVEDGAMMLNGKKYYSPSPAAMSVTDSAINGWRFWECRFPGKSGWQLLENLRR